MVVVVVVADNANCSGKKTYLDEKKGARAGDSKLTNSKLEKWLEKDKSANIRQKNLQPHANEIFKVENEIAPELMNDIFHKIPYIITNTFRLHRSDKNSV